MFDYQAGEKYKLTLIMVAIAGLIAGMFFTLLMVPTDGGISPARRRAMAAMTKANSDPDVTGRRGSGISAAPGAAAAMAQEQSASQLAAVTVDRRNASEFMKNWLPRVWDLSAQTASTDQEEAIKWMTPECAAAYRQNIWSTETAQEIAGAGLQSEFHTQAVDVSDNLQDGSVVVKVRGTQVLRAQTGQKSKDVNLEYMLKQTSDGIRVAGISEGRTQ